MSEIVMANESVILTETAKQLLARRKLRKFAPEKVYSLDTLSSNAELLKACGGQAALVFRAIVGSYTISAPDNRRIGFKIHPTFASAIKLPSRQLQGATKALEDAGYIERDISPGRKSIIRLKGKGKRALVQYM